MQADFVQHPAEIKKTSQFFRGTAEGDGGHEKHLAFFGRGSRAIVFHPEGSKRPRTKSEIPTWQLRDHILVVNPSLRSG
jgi:hypothetical protein